MNSIVINLTDKCNLSCIYCFGPKNQDKFLSFTQIQEIVQNTDFKYFVLTGWEPILHRDISKIIKYISNNNKKVILHTNGLLLDEKFILEHKDYIYRINLPIDTLDIERASKLRWFWHLFKIKKNIEFIKALDLKFSITTTFTSINQDDFDDLADYIQIIKPDLWRIFEFKNLNNNPKLDFLVPKNIAKIQIKIKELTTRTEFIKADDKFYDTYDYMTIN